MLAEDDPVKMEMDIVDEQLDTTARTFMGLTVGCARCHDHKFDPIPQADYYSLAGIFKSSKTMENFNVVAQWHEYVLAPEAEREKLKEHKAKIEAKNKEIGRISRRGEQEADYAKRASTWAAICWRRRMCCATNAFACGLPPRVGRRPRTPYGARRAASIAATCRARWRRKSRTRPRAARAPTSPSTTSRSRQRASTRWTSSKKKSAAARWTCW